VRYVIEHRARVALAEPVRDYHAEVRLAPAAGATQRVVVVLRVTPDTSVRTFVDYFGNQTHTFSIAGPCGEVAVEMRAEVETLLANPFGYAPIAPAREREWLHGELRAHPPLWDYVLHRSALTPDLADRSAGTLPWPAYDAGIGVLEQVQRASAWIAETFDLAEEVATDGGPLAAVVAARQAGAADLAHLLVSVVRAWGFAARYVVGHVDPEYDAPLVAQALHPWVEVLVPGAGWRGVDPSLQLVADDTFVPVAVGRDRLDTTLWRAAFVGFSDDGPPEHAHAMRRVQAQGGQ
jgi:transglutaminase-like putative cysteine protease